MRLYLAALAHDSTMHYGKDPLLANVAIKQLSRMTPTWTGNTRHSNLITQLITTAAPPDIVPDVICPQASVIRP